MEIDSSLKNEPGALDVFFHPSNVALIGATERAGSVGRAVLENLLRPPAAVPVFPVNSAHPLVLGRRAFASIRDIPVPVELAVVVVPAASVPGVILECADAGVKGAVVISAGFREHGQDGAGLEQEILSHARNRGMRIIGPNCLGVMSPHAGLNATFAAQTAHPGSVAFLSQSGALCTAMLDWSAKECIGFSAFVSVGTMLDVGWGELIQYLGDDAKTKSIVLYMETVGDARSFLSAAREVALSKPIIVIKAGRTAEAANAASSHTGSLAGSDEVLDAAFERCGVLRLNRVADVFYMVEVLSKQPRPNGPRLTILTNAGGFGVLATDSLLAEGGELAQLTPQTLASLDAILPAHWSHANPVDILGDATPDRYAKAIEIIAKDSQSDGLLVIMTPQGNTDAASVAEVLAPYARKTRKPLMTSFMGAESVHEALDILNRAGIPTFSYPDTAARAFHYLWSYTDHLRSLYETPSMPDFRVSSARVIAAGKIAARARAENRTLLDEFESKQVLIAYGIPVVSTAVAQTEEEAVEAARKTGFPVVLKLFSRTITHKTDVGGVKLNLGDAAAVGEAFREIQHSVAELDFLGVTVQPMTRFEGYELILGSSVDSQFGPVLLFGSGGQLVEVYRDHALGLPPLNTTLARRLMERTKIWKALKGIRGRAPVDLHKLEELLVLFSELVISQPWIKEIDINPLLAGPGGLMALDARIVLHPPDTPEADLPKPAIRPYPLHEVKPAALFDGTQILLRPIRPEDEPEMIIFHQGLSERTVYQRFFSIIKLETRTSHERLSRICFADYDRQMVLVAERGGAIAGVARLARIDNSGTVEFAIVVADAYQRKGLGRLLTASLLDFARRENVKKIIADILPGNREMQDFCRRMGFTLRSNTLDNTVRAELIL
ncbi:MAG: bifunctional acetate--CoA ligase family protein/GNAT family N-acetyltransferase [Bryobacteraceae bacterium]